MVITSCQRTEIQRVGFHAYEEYDTIFYCQDGNGHFVTPGLVEQLDSGLVTAALFTTTYQDSIKDEILLTTENYYLRDTLNYGFITEMVEVDSTEERFESPPSEILLFGELEVYYSSGDTVLQKDTIRFTRINPLTHERLVGELEDAQRTGIWLTYYDMDKTILLRKSIFVDGLRNGSDTVYYTTGKASIVSNWKNGKKHGLIETFSVYTGNVTSRVTFTEGFPSSTMYYFDHYNEVIDSLDLNSL